MALLSVLLVSDGHMETGARGSKVTLFEPLLKTSAMKMRMMMMSVFVFIGLIHTQPLNERAAFKDRGKYSNPMICLSWF